MGCYTELYSIEDAQALDGLAGLPSSMDWRLFRSNSHGRLFLDHGYDPANAYEAERFAHQPNFGGGSGWEAANFTFDAAHEHLNRLAKQPGMAEQMVRPVIKYALRLSELVQGRVFAAFTDNQGHEAVCIVERGKVLSLKFCNLDDLVSVNAAGVVSSSPRSSGPDDESVFIGSLVDAEAERQFGYRLVWDPCSPTDDPDTYTLVSHSPPRPRRRKSIALTLLRTLIRGPH